jgi:hypothetical protein
MLELYNLLFSYLNRPLNAVSNKTYPARRNQIGIGGSNIRRIAVQLM